LAEIEISLDVKLYNLPSTSQLLYLIDGLVCTFGALICCIF